MSALSENDMIKLNKSHICIIGCGGLGGNIIESTSRIGIEKITVIDGDVFEKSNLNRQLLSTSENIGSWKVNEANKRVKLINPNVDFSGIKKIITKENIDEVIPQNIDYLIDAVDNIKTRFLLEEFAENNEIPLIHGAIGGWYGQVSVVMPGDKTISKIYQESFDDEKDEEPMGNLAFLASLVASIEVSELIKMMTGKGSLLTNKMLYIDLKENSYNMFEL